MSRLFESLELLSNQKSFVLGIANARQKLWLLLHLKSLKIKTYKLHYRVDNGIRQRANTVHPIRQMRKKFSTTDQLLDYLENKSYELLYLEIFFENGWSFKEQSNHLYRFHANSIQERNDLINKFMKIAGHDEVSFKDLKLNITYFLSSLGEFYDLDLGVSPDEFWSKEKRDNWVKNYNKKMNPENEETEEHFEPFKIIDPFKEFKVNVEELSDPPF